MKRPIVAIVGPTASGKTRRAVDLANAIHGEIISGDSRQIYRGMTIGTGKDLEEYGKIPYHLIDIKPAGYKYNLHEYVRDFHQAVNLIDKNNHFIILCGGTGMYIETVLSGVVLPEVPVNRDLRERLADKSIMELTEILRGYKTLHNVTDVDTVQRAIRAIEIAVWYQNHPEIAKLAHRTQARPLDTLIIGIDIPRDIRRLRISQRLETRIKEGMIDEVKGLLESGLHPDDLIYYGLEYKFITQYLTNKTSFQQMKTDLEIAIHQFAKRQMTWFRGMERRGFNIHWLPYDMPKDVFINEVEKLLEEKHNNKNS